MIDVLATAVCVITFLYTLTTWSVNAPIENRVPCVVGWLVHWVVSGHENELWL